MSYVLCIYLSIQPFLFPTIVFFKNYSECMISFSIVDTFTRKLAITWNGNHLLLNLPFWKRLRRISYLKARNIVPITQVDLFFPVYFRQVLLYKFLTRDIIFVFIFVSPCFFGIFLNEYVHLDPSFLFTQYHKFSHN